MTRFGQRMRQRREQLSISQQELSRLTGIPQSRLSEFEGGGRSEMTVSTARKIARALGVGIDYLASTWDTQEDQEPAASPGPRGRGRPPKRLAVASR